MAADRRPRPTRTDWQSVILQLPDDWYKAYESQMQQKVPQEEAGFFGRAVESAKAVGEGLTFLPGGVVDTMQDAVFGFDPTDNSPLALRVLTRPHAVLYKDASEANPADSNVPVFKPYFVYTRPGGEARETGTGWYEVGTDENGTIAGWIKSSDVFEWKQTMCLAYSHPLNRKPVLMFEDKEKLDALLKADPAARSAEVQGLYAAIDNAATTPLAKDYPVLSVEPKMAVDMTKQFYLLPILEHEEMTLKNHEGRLVRLAAVSGKADTPRATSKPGLPTRICSPRPRSRWKCVCSSQSGNWTRWPSCSTKSWPQAVKIRAAATTSLRLCKAFPPLHPEMRIR